ncbi:UDP-glucose 4-epimerase GalE [bacterium]|nr:UDP-glucose 4-epimerase GalE [bacterium]NUN46526.1 UDP-glucose 4-epimerase GalE [bacterium]
MKILITGGAGYIGSHAVRLLLRAGHDVVILDNLIFGHADFAQGCPLIQADLSDMAMLEKTFEQHKPQAVLHFAAYAYVGESVENPGKYYQNNVGSTLHLLEAMVRHNVKKLVFSSTCATYGIPQKTPLTEEHPQVPINPYGQTKKMVEQILSDFDRAHGLKSVCLRYFNASGADPDGGIGEDHNPETHLIPLVLDAAMGRRSHITVYGADYETPDGTCVRDYIHVTDLADAHIRALDFLVRENRSDFFNLGNGKGFSVKEIIAASEKVTGKSIPVHYGERRPGDPAVLVGSAEKAKAILGWQPQYNDIHTIIQTAWNWHQSRFGSKRLV